MREGLPKILCVDDEPAVLNGLERILRRHFDVATAESGEAGLVQLDTGGEFAVVTSDLRMPGMDGVAFLSACREKAPDTTRILLTGNADLTAAVAAVNEGNIFRLLSKPCEPASLRSTIEMAAEQHRLVTSERVLLQETLHGSVRMLTGALALANPTTFGGAAPLRRRAAEAAEALGSPATWIMDLAVMLSEVACITLPPGLLERYLAAGPVDASEREMLEKLPEIAVSLIADIPRLGQVREILQHQNENFSATNPDSVPLGARILRASRDLEVLIRRGEPLSEASETLAARVGLYDPRVLVALTRTKHEVMIEFELEISQLEPGMLLLAPVEALDDRLLVAQGQEVSVSLIRRLQNFAEGIGVKEPIRVGVVQAPESATAKTGTNA